jgi:hypothetical protein
MLHAGPARSVPGAATPINVNRMSWCSTAVHPPLRNTKRWPAACECMSSAPTANGNTWSEAIKPSWYRYSLPARLLFIILTHCILASKHGTRGGGFKESTGHFALLSSLSSSSLSSQPSLSARVFFFFFFVEDGKGFLGVNTGVAPCTHTCFDVCGFILSFSPFFFFIYTFLLLFVLLDLGTRAEEFCIHDRIEMPSHLRYRGAYRCQPAPMCMFL